MTLILGTDSSDTINGTNLDDTINGGRGNDSIHAAVGDDVIYGVSGHNKLAGGAGRDVIYSGRHSSALIGGQGDDILVADLSRGADHVLTGGQLYKDDGTSSNQFVLTNLNADRMSEVVITDYVHGQDVLIVEDSEIDLANLPDGYALAASEDGASAILNLDSGDTVTLIGLDIDGITPVTPVEIGNGQVDGTEDADLIDARYTDAEGEMVSDSADLVYANDGDDTVYGYRGNDTIDGGAGNDHLYGVKNNNMLNGGEGDDYLHSGRHASELDGGQGNDTLVGSLSHGGDHTLAGGGEGDADTFVVENTMGTRLGDILVTDFDVTVDTLVIEDETVDVTNLPDTVSLSEAENGDVVLTLAAGHTVTLAGVTAADLIVDPIPETNGIVDGTEGDDIIDGASYVDEDGDQLTDGDDVVHGNGGDDYIRSDRGDDTLLGGAGNDTLIGIRHNNHLDGGEGDDFLYSGRHASELDGGQGNDTLVGSLSHGGDHTLTGGGEGDADTFVVENTMGTRLGDILVTDFDVTVDTLVIEDETVDVTNLPDTVSLSEAENGDVVLTLAAGHTVTLAGVTAADLIVDPIPETNGIVDGTEGDDIIDGASYVDEDGDQLTDGDDVVHGNGGDDYIRSDRGDDTLLGGAGNDTLIGIRHNNHLDGGEGDDVIYTGYHTSSVIGGEGADDIQIDVTRGADHVIDISETEASIDSLYLFAGDENAKFSDGREADVTIEGFDVSMDHLYIEHLSVTRDQVTYQESETGDAQAVIGDTTVTFSGVSLAELQGFASEDASSLLMSAAEAPAFDEETFPEDAEEDEFSTFEILI